jgi:glycosyltransferase involved in cell wall biosynthesis
MTRSPLQTLQQVLDEAAAQHPASPTLREFRAPDWLVAAEEAALAGAESLITPHSQLAEKLNVTHPGQVEHIAWSLPILPASGQPGPDRSAVRPSILFAASGLARKGAYEMREVIRHAPFSLHVLGRAQDTAEFWRGLDIDWVMPGTDPLAGIACVVLPAFVEHQPRLFLRAIARGIPVICSPACGLGSQTGVTLIEAGNADALAAAIKTSLDSIVGRKWVKSAE